MRTALITLLVVVVGGALAAAWFVFGAGTSETSVDVEDVVAGADETPVGTTTDPADEPVATPDTPGDEAASPSTGGGGVRAYRVDQEASTVAYAIDEVLRGVLTRVNGTTSEVATTASVDPADPTTLELGDVVVNARTFTTDYAARDQAVRGRILGTDDPDNELIVFSPTGTSALPQDATSGFMLDVTGDLTISGVTNEATFPLSVEPEGDGFRLSGETTVLRSDHGLEIPLTGFTTDVTDEVILRVDLLVVPA